MVQTFQGFVNLCRFLNFRNFVIIFFIDVVQKVLLKSIELKSVEYSTYVIIATGQQQSKVTVVILLYILFCQWSSISFATGL